MFFCPACQCGHGVWTTRKNDRQAIWNFNGNFEKPTFQPSLRVSFTQLTAKGQKDWLDWKQAGCPDRQGKEFESIPAVCHSVITDGIINFCNDCTHKLAGQSVPMVAF